MKKIKINVKRHVRKTRKGLVPVRRYTKKIIKKKKNFSSSVFSLDTTPTVIRLNTDDFLDSKKQYVKNKKLDLEDLRTDLRIIEQQKKGQKLYNEEKVREAEKEIKEILGPNLDEIAKAQKMVRVREIDDILEELPDYSIEELRKINEARKEYLNAKNLDLKEEKLNEKFSKQNRKKADVSDEKPRKKSKQLEDRKEKILRVIEPYK